MLLIYLVINLTHKSWQVDASKFNYDDEEEAYAIISALRLWKLKEIGISHNNF